jgi:ABC-2 type transport system permease protein
VLGTLVVKTWRDHWRAVLGWSLGLTAISTVQLAVYPSVRDAAEGTSQLMDSFPEAFKTMFRITDYTSGPGYLGAELFSIMVPLVFIGIGATFGAGATAVEEERGTADLLLTLPVTRTQVLLAKLVALLSAPAALGVLLWVVLLLGSRAVGLSGVGAGKLLVSCLAAVLLGWLYTGVGLLVGAWSGRRAVALGSAIAAALAGFLLFSLGPLVDGLRPWLRATPFHWAMGNDPLRNGVPPGYVALLLATSLVLYGLSVVAFRRRDISA